MIKDLTIFSVTGGAPSGKSDGCEAVFEFDLGVQGAAGLDT